MHLVTFLVCVFTVSILLHMDLEQLDIVWHRQSLWLLMLAAFSAVTGTLVNFWWMWCTQCPLFLHWEWDVISSWVMAGTIAAIAVGATLLFVKRQIQFRKILAVSEKTKDPALLAMVEDYSRRMFLEYVPDLYVGQLNYHFGATFSVIKPVILISSHTLENLDSMELQALIAHELAHIKQKDLLASASTTLIRDLLWFIPSIYPVFQAFRFSLEIQADRMTAITTQKPGALASALLKFQPNTLHIPPHKDFLYLVGHSAKESDCSGVGFLLSESDTSLQRRLEHLLEDRYLTVKELSIAPWKLKTVIFTVLWLVLLWVFPYGHLFLTAKQYY